MRIVKDFLKNGIVYSISTTAVKMLQFIMLPFLWSVLSPEDFGTWSLFQLIVGVLSTIYDAGMSSSIQRFYHSWGESRKEYIGAAYIIIIFFSVLLSTTLLTYGESLFFKFTGLIPFEIVRLSIFTAFFQCLININISLVRTLSNLKYYTFFSISFVLTQIILSFLALFYFKYGIWGYLVSCTLSSILFGIISILNIVKESKWPKRLINFSAPLKYGLPIFPAAVVESFISTIERIFLEKVSNLASIGIYTLANQLGGLVNITNQILKSSFIPIIYKSRDNENFEDELGYLSQAYFALITIVSIGVVFTLDNLIILTGREKYYEITLYIPIVVVGYWASSASTAFARGIDLSNKTIFSPLVPLFRLFVSLFLSYYLIKKYSLQGAVIAFALASLISTIFNIFLAYKVFPRKTYYKKISYIIVIFAISLFINHHLSKIINFIILDLIIVFFASSLIVKISFGDTISFVQIENYLKKLKRQQGN